MRFSTTALLALPLLASAAESPFEQYKAKFQNFLSSFGASSPGADKADGQAAAAPNVASSKSKGKGAVEPKKIETLTLENWRDTLYAPVKAEATQPEEWLVLLTGQNKTCYGRCGKIEAAFNESAAKFAALPQSPHLGRVNCDDQPVLCNTWSAGTGALWIFEMLPTPAPVDIHTKRLNLTTTTPQDIVDAYTAGSGRKVAASGADAAEARKESGWRQVDPNGYFHPFEGKLAKYGLAVPIAYVLWVLNVIPSWGMMLLVSFLSRSMMNRRMGGMDRPAGAPGAGAPRGAPPGDGRS